MNFSFAFKFANDMNNSGWNSTIEVSDSDFLPYFDASTNYDSATGTLTWALESQATVDAYYVAFRSACNGCDTLIAVLPGTATSYTIPAAELGLTPSDDDIVLLFGLDLPDGVDVNSYNPSAIVAYNVNAFNFWSNFDISAYVNDVIGDFIGDIIP
jgi:hypothetical protein